MSDTPTVVTLHVPHTVTIKGVPAGVFEVGDTTTFAAAENFGEVTEQMPNGAAEVVSVEPTNGAVASPDCERVQNVE